jgi:hypothetical protein
MPQLWGGVVSQVGLFNAARIKRAERNTPIKLRLVIVGCNKDNTHVVSILPPPPTGAQNEIETIDQLARFSDGYRRPLHSNMPDIYCRSALSNRESAKMNAPQHIWHPQRFRVVPSTSCERPPAIPIR